MSSSARIETRIGPDYSFQTALIAQCLTNLRTGDKRCLLAAGCGAGKTEMMIEIVASYRQRNLNSGKVLLLAHGTTAMREEIAARFARDRRFKSIEVTTSTTEEQLLAADVHIAIPQSNQKIDDQSYTFFIQDEAHQFHLRPVTQAILEKCPDVPQLLVTASHGHFTRIGWGPTVFFSQMEMLDRGIILDPRVAIFPTTQEFRSFTGEGHLSESEALRNCGVIVRRILKEAKGKTLIACHSQDAARSISKQLKKQGAVVVQSTYEDDPDSLHFRRFITRPEVQFLIVVFRGVIGFNMPELQTVFDLTASQNVDRISQLLGRVVRVDTGNKEKVARYFKLAPVIQGTWYRHVMSGVLWLAHPENYRRWDGKIDSIRIPVTRATDTRSRVGTKGKKELSILEPFLPTWNELQDVWEQAQDPEGDYVWTTLLKQRQQLEGINRDPEGAKAWIREFALRTGGLPSQHSKDPEEARHARLFSNYTCLTTNCFDPVFRQWCLDHGWVPVSEKAGKCLRELRAFSEANGWVPRQLSKDPNERKLGQHLSNYVKKDPPGFAGYMAKYPTWHTYQMKQDWKNFYAYLRSALSFPSKYSKDHEEKRLAQNVANTWRKFPEFTAECDRIAVELGIPKPAPGVARRINSRQKEKKS